jgi:hypothetical protein
MQVRPTYSCRGENQIAVAGTASQRLLATTRTASR